MIERSGVMRNSCVEKTVELHRSHAQLVPGVFQSAVEGPFLNDLLEDGVQSVQHFQLVGVAAFLSINLLMLLLDVEDLLEMVVKFSFTCQIAVITYSKMRKVPYRRLLSRKGGGFRPCET